MTIKEYTKEDFCIIDTACRNAYSFGGGCISFAKKALEFNGIKIPKNLDSLVFMATEKIEKELRNK